jgi:hypothetical protein
MQVIQLVAELNAVEQYAHFEEMPLRGSSRSGSPLSGRSASPKALNKHCARVCDCAAQIRVPLAFGSGCATRRQLADEAHFYSVPSEVSPRKSASLVPSEHAIVFEKQTQRSVHETERLLTETQCKHVLLLQQHSALEEHSREMEETYEFVLQQHRQRMGSTEQERRAIEHKHDQLQQQHVMTVRECETALLDTQEGLDRAERERRELELENTQLKEQLTHSQAAHELATQGLHAAIHETQQQLTASQRKHQDSNAEWSSCSSELMIELEALCLQRDAAIMECEQLQTQLERSKSEQCSQSEIELSNSMALRLRLNEVLAEQQDTVSNLCETAETARGYMTQISKMRLCHSEACGAAWVRIQGLESDLTRMTATVVKIMEHRRRLQDRFDELEGDAREQSAREVYTVCSRCSGSVTEADSSQSRMRGLSVSRASKERIRRHPPRSPCFQRFAQDLLL